MENVRFIVQATMPDSLQSLFPSIKTVSAVASFVVYATKISVVSY